VRIGEVTGAVRLSNSGGRTWIGHAHGDLALSSGSCDFDIDRADGDIAATTASGAIRIGRLTRGQARLMSGSGDIEVGIDEGAAAHLDVESERGSVRDAVARQGNAGPFEVSVRARTRYGDVIIRRAATLSLTGRA
jgi:hypothetical protein